MKKNKKDLKKKQKNCTQYEKKGYSDNTIADLLEVSVNTVQQWFSSTNIAKP